MSKIFIGGAIVCIVFMIAPSVRAHGDSHAEDEPHTEVVKKMSIAEMEQMVKLLQQLVAALLELQKIVPQAGTVPVVPVAAAAPGVHDDEMDEHMEEHHEESAEDTVAKLVIEIEPHYGKTHAHVRYTDKPEEMFFVESSIDNEDGIVADIAAKTGLSADVVRAALKYMQ